MFKQTELGATEREQKREIRQLIKSRTVTFAGNRKRKICGSGKRMNPANRVFFEDKAAAVRNGYRPCGNCMPEHYQKWKSIQV